MILPKEGHTENDFTFLHSLVRQELPNYSANNYRISKMKTKSGKLLIFVRAGGGIDFEKQVNHLRGIKYFRERTDSIFSIDSKYTMDYLKKN